MAAASDQSQPETKGEYGFEVAELTPEIAQRFKIEETAGVVVINVDPNGKAKEAGIQQGDLIIEVNRVDVDSVDDFKNLIDKHKKDDGVDLLVKRMNAGLVVIRLA
jgi:serine protease Do